MKVVCDNCRAVYKIPDAKLVKPINKATCRNCGYRMLIPRPPATADSDFSTLVTAVPPTPMGAPPREKSTSTIEVEPAEGTGDSTEVINKKEESTKPGDQKVVDDDMLLLPDTPSQDPSQRENDSSESVPDDSFLGAEEDTRVTEISKHSFSSGDTVKAPSPLRTQPSNAPAAYDPSGDLTIAIIGTLGAMVGTFPMAALVFSPNPFLLWFGQAVAFGGATTALLILLTGGRGTRPASRVVSLLIGASLAVVVASIVTGVKLSAEHIDWAELSSTGAAIEAPATPEQDAPTVNEAPSPEGDEPTGTEEATDTPDEDAPSEDDEGTPDEPTVEATTTAAAKSTTSGPSTASTRSSSKPSPRPSSRSSDDDFDIDDIINAPTPAEPIEDEEEDFDGFDDELDLDDDPLADVTRKPAPAPKPAPKGSDSVPIEVIDVMLRNHMEVKKCFYYYAQSHGGKLPPRIDIKFTLQPSGRASSLTIKHSEHSKTDLEQCLRTAIGGITFPPTSKPQKLTYPFVLQ